MKPIKTLIIGNKGRVQRNMAPYPAFAENFDCYLVEGTVSQEEILATCPDASLIITDPTCQVSAYLMDNMPNLKLIHSEAVGFNGVDVAAAKERGIPVCNCKGINAMAVAEQTLLLMLGLLRGVVSGDQAFRAGQQIQVKEHYMHTMSLREVADCTVGLLGFGDISKNVAKLLHCLGANVYYYDMFPATPEVEAACHATFLDMDTLVSKADILSIHVPYNPHTEGMVNKALLSKLPQGAFVINTARGEIVNDGDLIEAIASGHVGGAGLDTVSNEPVQADNVYLHLSPDVAEKILFSCHIAGISATSFRRGVELLYNNVMTLLNNEPLTNVVNG